MDCLPLDVTVQNLLPSQNQEFLVELPGCRNVLLPTADKLIPYIPSKTVEGNDERQNGVWALHLSVLAIHRTILVILVPVPYKLWR